MVLLGIIALELALNRLLVPTLRPATAAPPGWYEHVDRLALFVFYFASALAVVVLGRQLVDLARHRVLSRSVTFALIGVATAMAPSTPNTLAAPISPSVTGRDRTRCRARSTS